MQENPDIKRRELFKNIHGIGSTNVEKLLKYESIEQLREASASNPKLLFRQEKVGLKYYEEFLKKIPRQEVYQLSEIVRNTAESVYGKDGLMFEVGGSYRRGRSVCGDMDILLSFHSKPQAPDLLPLINRLEERGFLTDHLTKPESLTGEVSQT